MTEKRFLGFMFIEGMLLTILGLCILILPKLTSLSFGVMLSSAFITYGIYKIVCSIINRTIFSNMFCGIFLGALLLTIGILLLFVPKINLLWLVALTGVYFILESLSITKFVAQIRNVLNFWGCKMFAGIILFLIGLIIILGLPMMSFWVVAILSGIGFLIKGTATSTLSTINKNINNSCL